VVDKSIVLVGFDDRQGTHRDVFPQWIFGKPCRTWLIFSFGNGCVGTSARGGNMGLSVVTDQPSTFSKRIMLAAFCQSADEFRGGVLSTLSAWVIGFASFMVRVRAERKTEPFPSACFYDSRIIMKKSINDHRKPRGRPATGTAPMVGVRMTEEFQDAIKAWANKQSDDPSLAAAIRRLVEIGLKAKK
jgi:hypothetical protein